MTADRCLTRKIDTSAEEMRVYDDLWEEQVAPKQDRRLMMTRLLYLAPNERYDLLMRDLNKLSRDTLSDINDGSKRGIVKLLYPNDLSYLWKYWQEIQPGIFGAV
ncbi:FAD dependent oxidoreductase [Natrinema pellirubrum DSM 15624]|nr:FAD dependent oxidoreductase [Natrinema pellirubrum DSM 15624]